MAHFVRTQPDGVWVLDYKPTGADLIDLDEKTLKSVNGEGGGTWLPSSGIVVGGAGFQPGAAWSLSGGSANATGQITFGRGTLNDYFSFNIAGHPENAFTLLGLLCEVYSEFPEQCRANLKSIQTNAIQPTYAGIVTLATGARFVSPLRVRSGGFVTQIDFQFVVGQTHANVPATLPRFRAFAVDVDGEIFPLKAPDNVTDDDGFQFLTTPANVGAYNNGAAPQVFSYTCDQNTGLDVSKYSYFVEFIDESGTNAWTTTGNTFISTSASITSFGPSLLLDQRS